MSRDAHDDECPGCRPAMIDVKTGKVLSECNPIMQTMLAVWGNTSLAERQAYHRVMCQNSRDFSDLLIVKGIINRLKKAREAAK